MSATTTAAGLAVFIGTVLVFVELVSLAHAYKNVNRFFFTKISYTVGSETATVSSTQDPYQIFGIPFTASLVTVSADEPNAVIITLDQASSYSFASATIDAQTESGGFVAVDKSVANNLILIPYTLSVGAVALKTGNQVIDLRITWDKKASK